jgi:hypothetical protein
MGSCALGLICATAMAAIINMLYNLRHNFQVFLNCFRSTVLSLFPKEKLGN